MTTVSDSGLLWASRQTTQRDSFRSFGANCWSAHLIATGLCTRLTISDSQAMSVQLHCGTTYVHTSLRTFIFVRKYCKWCIFFSLFNLLAFWWCFSSFMITHAYMCELCMNNGVGILVYRSCWMWSVVWRLALWSSWTRIKVCRWAMSILCHLSFCISSTLRMHTVRYVTKASKKQST